MNERLVVIIDASRTGKCRLSGWGGTDEDWEYLRKKVIEAYGGIRLGIKSLVRLEK